MNKLEIIEEISQNTTYVKKKILAIRKFYLNIKNISVANFDTEDKVTSVLLINFSYYEKFIKINYNIIFNFINHLKKHKKNYPKEFDYLGFLYTKLSDNNKKSKIRQFTSYEKKDFLDTFNFNKFLSDNQKLSNIEHLIKLNLLILNIEINTLETNKYFPTRHEKKEITDILKELSNLYALRNDRIHGTYQENGINDVEIIFDLFIFAISTLSETLIDILESHF